jgi:hypothetical protein
MANKISKICYLCGKQIEGRSHDDHVPPKQCFPKEIRMSQELNLQLVPSHKKCNNGYKDDEEYFYASLYPLVDKYNPTMAATILRDFSRRCQKPQMRAKLRGIFKNASRRSEGEIILPADIVEINIDLCRIQRIAGKISRGVLFLLTATYFSEDNIVDMRVCDEPSEVPEMYRISWEIAGSVQGVYPKVFSYKYVPYNESHILSMLFWEAFIFCVTIQNTVKS